MKNTLILLALFMGWMGCSSPTSNKTEGEASAEKAEKAETAYKKTTPKWAENATIYEVNIRQHTPEGTFKAFTQDIPRLKEMGIEILWLMPVSPIGEKNRKGPLGSYYSIKDYTKVNPEFGSFADFQNLVRTAHENDMKVILDWVANHTAWDHPWVDQHPDWYTKDSTGNNMPPEGTDWSDVLDLNYENEDLRKAMIQSMKFWVKEGDVDGFRCDVASWVPTDFWNKARKSLDEVKPVFMLAEAEAPELHEKAFDMSYAWEFLHIMNGIAKGEKELSAIDDYMAKEDTNHAPDDYRMYFTTNHDENSWNGTVFDRFGEAHKTFAVLAYTIDGMPLVYSGQESGMDYALKFFDKDTIEWGDIPLESFYSKLLQLNQNNKALWNGISGGDFTKITTNKPNQVYAYTRTNDDNKVVVILNLKSSNPIEVTLSKGSHQGEYTELFSGEKVALSEDYTVTLEPYGYQVFYN